MTDLRAKWVLFGMSGKPQQERARLGGCLQGEPLALPEWTDMLQPGPQSPSDKGDPITRNDGNTLIRTLPATSEPGFAPSYDPNAEPSDCLQQIEEKSLVRDGADRRDTVAIDT